MRTRFSLTFVLFLWLTACTAVNTTLPESDPTPEEAVAPFSPLIPKPSAEIKSTLSASSPVPGLVPPEIVEKAKTDLSRRSHIDAEHILVADIRTVSWPDGSIDCSQPDDKEAEGSLTGYQIRLEADGRYYVYRADQTGHILLCPEPKPDEPGLR